MKKVISFFMCVLLMSALTGCGQNTNSNTNATAIEKESNVAENETNTNNKSNSKNETSSEQEKETDVDGNNNLVVYFSATGTTKGVAEKIADITNADTYEIKATIEYTSEDLDWSDSNSRTTKEQNDSSVRPEIAGSQISLEKYRTIYIGYPIWWGEEPRIMDTFVESYNFDGITMIPFCTSGSSDIGRSGKNLAENAGSGNWIDGQRFGSGASESEIQSWINKLQ